MELSINKYAEMSKLLSSTHQPSSAQLDAIQAAEQGDGDAIGVEKSLSHTLHLSGIHGVDAGDKSTHTETIGHRKRFAIASNWKADDARRCQRVAD